MGAKSMKILDLFSGIGGFAIAAHWVGFETAQFVEIDPFCQKVLAKNFPNIPIHDDITTFTPPSRYDIITAGFPCQDISSANPNGRGLEGERSGLFFRVVDLVRDIQPRFVLLENVSALLTARNGTDMGVVLRELSLCGYAAEWQTVSASSLGAPHRRNRVFIVAYAHNDGQHRPKNRQSLGKRDDGNTSGQKQAQQFTGCSYKSTAFTPNPQSKRSPRYHHYPEGTDPTGIGGSSFWQQQPHPEPSICRMDARVSPKLDVAKRLKALGNTVTPQQALIPFLRIKQLCEQQNETQSKQVQKSPVQSHQSTTSTVPA
jgi:DNA (cytosine-5)-methyltransferase 1